MGKTTTGEGDCDHLSHLAFLHKMEQSYPNRYELRIEGCLSDAWTGSTNKDSRRSLWRGYESITLGK